MKELTRRSLFGAFGALIAALGLAKRSEAAADGSFEVVRSDAQWRAILQPQQYEVLRRHGTEPPFSSPLDHEKRPGTYACAGCALALFDSKTKFDSGTGWPSFYAPLPGAVATTSDTSLFMVRTEVHCRRCGGHLGHVFDDGPKPTGLRYCMNGVALDFHARAA
ncbi:MAG: peptide-methionine (R)-S-oxide reductase MsrB [Candidatus Baltobacteraceae bacterium]